MNKALCNPRYLEFMIPLVNPHMNESSSLRTGHLQKSWRDLKISFVVGAFQTVSAGNKRTSDKQSEHVHPHLTIALLVSDSKTHNSAQTDCVMVVLDI